MKSLLCFCKSRLPIFSKSKAPARRKTESRRIGAVLETCEERTLLSGVAIYPAEAPLASEVATKAQVDPSALPPATYNGFWFVASDLGSGSMTLSQFGKTFEGSMILGSTSIDVFKGKINGLTAKAKTRGFVLGEKVTGKFIVNQFNFGLNFGGSISAKGGPFLGGQTGSLNGLRP